MPEALKTLQLQFAEALTSPGEKPALYQQIGESHFAADQLLQIYRNNFVLSLTEALENTFPVLRAMVGDDFFAQLAKAFIRQIPLEKAAIADFGDQLPGFMSELEQLSEMPYLIDLAHLEWLYSWRINRMPQADSFPYDALAELNETDYEHLNFTLNPDLTLFQSEWAVIELFQRLKPWLNTRDNDDCQTEEAPLDGLNLEQPQQGYVVTTGLAETEVQSITPELSDFLNFCQSGSLFSHCPSEHADTLLQQSISQGLICGFILKPQQQVSDTDLPLNK